MKLAAIVCEYNPFHKGHQYHIEETKRKTGCDGIVAVMSGNFVQRGEGALFSKEVRSKTAVLGGADLVLELTPFFAVQSAESFALGALKIITSIPEVKYLSFGAEEEDIEILKKAAKILTDEPENYKIALKEELGKGISYPVAREKALINIGEKEIAKALTSPNNILGVEYLKALRGLESNIEPVLVKRVGAAHDSMESGEKVSASFLREAYLKGDKIAFENGIFGESTSLSSALSKIAFEKMILSRIITMSEEELKEVSEVSEGLENRIKKAAKEANSLEELAEKVKTKRYTLSKLRRILLCAGLGIKKEELYVLPPYAKILAFNENGQKILNKIKKTAGIPIVKNMTALKKLSDKTLLKQYERETELDRLYKLYTEEK